MSTDRERFTIRFSRNNKEQWRAYQALQAIPFGQRSEFICGLINADKRGQKLEDIVYRCVKRALNEYQGAPLEQQNKADDGVSEEMLDFLRRL